MKIEIEFTGSAHADLTIDGRKMAVVSEPGCTSLDGIESPETENTLGGIIASELYAKIGEFQQAWGAVLDFHPQAETWDVLTEEAADAAADKIW